MILQKRYWANKRKQLDFLTFIYLLWVGRHLPLVWYHKLIVCSKTSFWNHLSHLPEMTLVLDNVNVLWPIKLTLLINPLLVQWFCAEKREAVGMTLNKKDSSIDHHSIPFAKGVEYDPLSSTLGPKHPPRFYSPNCLVLQTATALLKTI